MAKIVVTHAEPDSSIANGLLTKFSCLMHRIRSRAYELFEQRGHQHGADLDDWLHAEEELLLPARIETKQDAGQYTLQISVPGFSGSDLNVYTLGDTLVINGEATSASEAEGLSTTETKGIFYQWPLPVGARAERITAEFKHEALLIGIPFEEKQTAVQTQTTQALVAQEPKRTAAAA